MRRLICDLFGHRWAVTCDEDMKFFYHRRLCNRCGEKGISYRRKRNYPADRTVPETYIPSTDMVEALSEIGINGSGEVVDLEQFTESIR